MQVHPPKTTVISTKQSLISNKPFFKTTVGTKRAKPNCNIPAKRAKNEYPSFDKLVNDSAHLFPSSSFDPSTGIRSNKALSEAVSEKNWLTDDHVNEYIQFALFKRKLFDKFYFCPTYLSGISTTTSHSYGILGHLDRYESVKKSIFLLPFNTSIHYGAHWMLGVALFKKKMLVICNSRIKGKYEYLPLFNMLIKVIRLNELLKEKDIDVSEWKFAICHDVAQQPNDDDCGVYVCFYVRQILSGKSLKICNHIKERKKVKEQLSIDYEAFDPNSKSNWKRAFTRGELDEIMKGCFTFPIDSVDSAEIFTNL